MKVLKYDKDKYTLNIRCVVLAAPNIVAHIIAAKQGSGWLLMAWEVCAWNPVLCSLRCRPFIMVNVEKKSTA